MTKRLMVAAVMLALICSARAYGEEKAKAAPAAKPAKQAKVVEQRIHEGDMAKLEHMISKAVIAKQGAGNWEYTAKRMKPPKNDKWEGRWNEMGAEGWEAIDHFDNVYIFKRPTLASSSAARVKPAESPAEAKPADTKAEEKAAKEKAKAEEKAQKDADKAAKKAAKEKEKAAKQAEKEAKKAVKETKKKGE